MEAEAVLHELGSRIRAQRKRIGASQENLALVAGVDRSYFGAVERGERNITFLVLYRLCVALRCDIALLTGNMPPPQPADID